MAQARITRPDGSPIRAVVVDDEDSLTDLLSMALRYEGWDVRLAADGQKAISVIRDFRPDVVVLDIMLPDIDGLTVLSRLRAEQASRLPFCFSPRRTRSTIESSASQWAATTT